MSECAETSLYKLKSDEEIKDYLLGNGWAEEGKDFFEKKYSRFRLILEREDDSNYGWRFMITGNFRLNNNVALQEEIKKLKSIFAGFWFRDDAYKSVVGKEVFEAEAQEKPVVIADSFNKDKDKIQYLVAALLSSGADFTFDKEYFVAYYADNAKERRLQLKVIKIEDQANLHFNEHGDLFFENGEKLI